MPMNIQGKTWGNFQGQMYDTYIPEQNIELGVLLIKQLYDSLDNPSPDRIGTLWNETGANQINDVGAIGDMVGNCVDMKRDNQLRKRLSYMDAYKDRLHDRTINQIDRQKAKSGLYRNSREACYPYRVEGINEKY